MNKLLLASLFTLLSTTTTTSLTIAAPEPVAPRLPMLKACEPIGSIVFQVDHKTDAPSQFGTSTIWIYGTGAWRRYDYKPGVKPASTHGCIAPTTLDPIAKELTAAKWKTTNAEVKCAAMSADYTEYRVNGKLVLTERMCDGLILDTASEKALANATKLAASLKSPRLRANAGVTPL
jgi:hypothetical protein